MLNWGDCVDSDSDEEYTQAPETVETASEISPESSTVKSRKVTENVSFSNKELILNLVSGDKVNA